MSCYLSHVEPEQVLTISLSMDCLDFVQNLEEPLLCGLSCPKYRETIHLPTNSVSEELDQTKLTVHLKLLAPSIFSAFSSRTSMLSKKSILGGKSVRSMHGGGSSTGGGGSAAPSSPVIVTGHDLNHSLLKCYLQQEVVPQQEEHQPCLREWWVILVELMQILTWCQWSVADTERGESRVRLRGVRAEVIMTRGHQVMGFKDIELFPDKSLCSREWVRLSF